MTDRPSPVLVRDLTWYQQRRDNALTLAAMYRDRRRRGDAKRAAEHQHEADLWAALATELDAYLAPTDEAGLW